MDIIHELTRDGDDDDDDDEGLCSDEDGGEGEEFETTWVAPTVLHIQAIVETAMVERVNRYLHKHPRTWQVIEDGDDDDDEDEEEEDYDDEDDEENKSGGGKMMISRMCFATKDSSATMRRYYDELQPAVLASVQQFIGRFVHFNIISSFDDYGCIEFRSGSYRDEAPEKTPLTSNDEGAIRTLVAIVLLTDTDGDIEMPLQLTADGQPLFLRGRAGDIFVWPACPLHPYAIKARDRETPLRYIQVNIA